MDHFPFLRLPAELRLMVYELCVGHRTITVEGTRICFDRRGATSPAVGVSKFYREDMPDIQVTASEALYSSIIRANKQIYGEAWRIYWSKNTFAFTHKGPSSYYLNDAVDVWRVYTRRAPASALPLIRSVEVGLWGFWNTMDFVRLAGTATGLKHLALDFSWAQFFGHEIPSTLTDQTLEILCALRRLRGLDSLRLRLHLGWVRLLGPGSVERQKQVAGATLRVILSALFPCEKLAGCSKFKFVKAVETFPPFFGYLATHVNKQGKSLLSSSPQYFDGFTPAFFQVHSAVRITDFETEEADLLMNDMMTQVEEYEAAHYRDDEMVQERLADLDQPMADC
jgi:hypothetical protein